MSSDFTNLEKIETLFREAPFAWFVCGGWAIDLFLHKVTRTHKDVDVAIWREEQLDAHTFMCQRGWSLNVAGSGKLTPWMEGVFLERPYHTIWCKNETHDPDFVELLLNEREGEYFLFRRDLSVKRPLSQAILQSESISFLAPEICLLYKAKQFTEPQNHADLLAVWPQLPLENQDWFRKNLLKLHREDHPWLADLS